MARRAKPSKPVLDRILRQAAYEYVALTESYHHFKEGGQRSVALFESCLIHARNACVFLYRTRGHKRDVFAIDYVSNWKASGPSTLMKRANRRMHVQLAHLSLDRAVAGNAYAWNDWLTHLPDLVDELNADWRLFRTRLTGKRATLFLAGIKAEKRRLRGD